MEFRESGMKKSLVEALIVAAAGTVVGLLSVFVHPDPIPFIASKEYETMVPCPVPGGEVKPMEVSKLKEAEDVFVVDARDEAAFEKWHYEGAVRLTWDYLDPIPEKDLRNLAESIARAVAKKVVVYGDGGNPDTGELLGKEISGKGIKNVYFIKGGAGKLKSGNEECASEEDKG